MKKRPGLAQLFIKKLFEVDLKRKCPAKNKLRKTGFKHSDWFKNLEKPIRVLL